MIFTVYISPHGLEKFKNYEKVVVSATPTPACVIKLDVELAKVTITEATLGSLSIERYSTPPSTGPK